MAQTYNKLKINIKEPITDIITAKQNDSNSRFLDVYLYDGGAPIDLTGHEVRIYMLKPDGTEIFNNGEITDAVSGRCQFELTDQALGAYGKLLCEISIWYDNVQILTSQTFGIDVVKNLRTNGSIESSNEYGALVVLFQNLYQSMDLMTDMVQNFGVPGTIADARALQTFWQALEYVARYMDTNLTTLIENAMENATVDGVITRIGENTDDGSTTLFGLLNNSVDDLSEIKTLVNKYIPWYASYSTNGIVLQSLSSPVTCAHASTYEDATKAFVFTAPANGVYVISAFFEGTNTHDESSWWPKCYVFISDYQSFILGDNTSATIHKDNMDASTSEAIAPGGTFETSLSGGVYLEEGRRYCVKVGSGNSYVSAVCKSLSVTYTKTAKTY